MIAYHDAGMTSKDDHERIVAGSPSIILVSDIFNNHGRLLRPYNQKVLINGSEDGDVFIILPIMG